MSALRRAPQAFSMAALISGRCSISAIFFRSSSENFGARYERGAGAAAGFSALELAFCAKAKAPESARKEMARENLAEVRIARLTFRERNGKQWMGPGRAKDYGLFCRDVKEKLRVYSRLHACFLLFSMVEVNSR